MALADDFATHSGSGVDFISRRHIMAARGCERAIANMRFVKLSRKGVQFLAGGEATPRV